MIKRIVLRRISNYMLQGIVIILAFTIIFAFLIYNFSRQKTLEKSLSNYKREAVVEAQIVDSKRPDTLIHPNIVYYLQNTDFSKYTEDLRLWSELKLDCTRVRTDDVVMNLPKQTCSGRLHLINHVSSSGHFKVRQDGHSDIQWLDDYSDEVFESDDLVLVLPHKIMQELPDDFNGFLTLDLMGRDFQYQKEPYICTFKVVGYYKSTTGDMFCPLKRFADLAKQIKIPELFYQAVRFIVKDNNTIEEMKVKYKEDINDHRWRFARSIGVNFENLSLLVKDDIFKEEIKRIERYIRHTKIIAPSLAFVSLASAFLCSFLLQMLRSHETVLQRIMGVKRRQLVLASLLEFIIYLAMAYMISAGIMVLIYKEVTLDAFVKTSLAIVLSAFANILALVLLTKNKLIDEVKQKLSE